MKWFFWTLVFLAFCVPLVFIGKGVDHLDIMKDRYKRALDAAAGSAARAIAYDDSSSLEKAGTGFGAAAEHSSNIHIDKDKALTWFYRVLFRNLGIEADESAQRNLKRYIPMKVIVGYDKLFIADMHDQWVYEAYYDFTWKENSYRFTLSDQVMNIDTNIWSRSADIGITQKEKDELLNIFIKDKMNEFLNSRENDESRITYYINISTDANDELTESISGVSFIVMAEGLPLPSLNPWRAQKLYAFALGGTELKRD